MKTYARIVDVLARATNVLEAQSLRSWLVVMFVIATIGPLGADVAFLLDIVAMVGVDVFIISLLLYLSGSVSAGGRAAVRRLAHALGRNGSVVLHRRCLRWSSSLGVYLAHNVLALLTPARFATLGLLCFGVCALV